MSISTAYIRLICFKYCRYSICDHFKTDRYSSISYGNKCIDDVYMTFHKKLSISIDSVSFNIDCWPRFEE